MLLRFRLRGRPYRAHAMCREGFRTDRALGLIYGPFAEKDENGKLRFIRTAEEASIRWRQCAYCGAK